LSLAFEDATGESHAFAAGIDYAANEGGAIVPTWSLITGTPSAWRETTNDPARAVDVARWMHIDLIVRSTGARLIVDGVEVAAAAPSPASLRSITHLRLRAGLAGAQWSGGDALRAYLDDVQLRTVP
jgi:hypothetical protein